MDINLWIYVLNRDVLELGVNLINFVFLDSYLLMKN